MVRVLLARCSRWGPALLVLLVLARVVLARVVLARVVLARVSSSVLPETLRWGLFYDVPVCLSDYAFDWFRFVLRFFCLVRVRFGFV